MLTHDNGSSARGSGTNQVNGTLCIEDVSTGTRGLKSVRWALLTGKVDLGAAWRQADINLARLTSGAHLSGRGIRDGREGSNDDGGELHCVSGFWWGSWVDLFVVVLSEGLMMS